MSRAVRLLAIIQLLRSARRARTAQQIADELEVNRRTVYRDVASLQALRVPIEGEPGVGYVMRAGLALPPMNLGVEEIEAVTVGLAMVQRTGDRGLKHAARRAADKLAERDAAERHAVRLDLGARGARCRRSHRGSPSDQGRAEAPDRLSRRRGGWQQPGDLAVGDQVLRGGDRRRGMVRASGRFSSFQGRSYPPMHRVRGDVHQAQRGAEATLDREVPREIVSTRMPCRRQGTRRSRRSPMRRSSTGQASSRPCGSTTVPSGGDRVSSSFNLEPPERPPAHRSVRRRQPLNHPGLARLGSVPAQLPGGVIVLQPDVVELPRTVGAMIDGKLGVRSRERIAYERDGTVRSRQHAPQTQTSWNPIHDALRRGFPGERYHRQRRPRSAHRTEEARSIREAGPWSLQTHATSPSRSSDDAPSLQIPDETRNDQPTTPAS